MFDGDLEPLILKTKLLKDLLIEDSISLEFLIGTLIVKSSSNSFPKE
jgi:hypothetical protein